MRSFKTRILIKINLEFKIFNVLANFLINKQEIKYLTSNQVKCNEKARMFTFNYFCSIIKTGLRPLEKKN